MKRDKLKFKIWHHLGVRVVIYRGVFGGRLGISPLEQGIIEGENPVFDPEQPAMWYTLKESVCLRMQTKMGGKFHLKLNTGERPIANKYREGKMKRTLKRELNSTWNCWKGNVWNLSFDGREISLALVWFTFLSVRSASVLVTRRWLRESGSSECYSPWSTWWPGPRPAASRFRRGA